MRKVILLLLLIVIFARPLLAIYTNAGLYFSRTYDARYQNLKKQYFSSQYMLKKNPGIIPDQTLEAFTSGAFIRNIDPILIVHDQPPLGRYLTGASIIIFQNENTFSILYFSFSLLGLFLIAKEVLKNNLIALVPIAIFANEPLMYSKLFVTPLLELTQLPFIIFSIYFFQKLIQVNIGKKQRHKFYTWAILTSLSLGFVISIRYFVLGGVLLLSFFLFFVFKKRFADLVRFMCFLPLAVVVLWLSYLKTVFDFNSIIKPFSVQKYIFAYQGSKFMLPFTVWDLLFFNRWHTWWADRRITQDSSWIITWPAAAVLSVALFIAGIIKKTRLTDPEIVLFFWVACYGAMLSVGTVSTRYFLPWVPFIYILACACICRLPCIRKAAHDF